MTSSIVLWLRRKSTKLLRDTVLMVLFWLVVLLFFVWLFLP
jgi:hypothetical protein